MNSPSLVEKQSRQQQFQLFIDRLRIALKIRNYSERTINNYCTIVRMFLRWQEFQNVEDDVSALQRYILYLKDRRKFSPRTINLQCAAVQFYYRTVLRKRQVTEELPRMKTGRALPKVYSEKQIEAFIQAVENSKHRLILVFAYGCGLRLEEVRTVHRRDFDFDKNLLRLRSGKGRKDRVIMLDPVIDKLLRDYLKFNQVTEYLFTSGFSGELLSRRTISKIFDNACAKAGIPKIGGIHTSRHSFATHLLEQGTDLCYIQELLGHSSSKTTEIYTHVSANKVGKIRSPIVNLNLQLNQR
ncbi:MAG: tyrosine-type recombinase/integrase [Chitinivibrionales bacterium]|nr:tyrosine-type recombinase/integrase [Chitinivibrionales bacterium]